MGSEEGDLNSSVLQVRFFKALSVYFRIFCKVTITSSNFCVVMVPSVFKTFPCWKENGLSTLTALLTGKNPPSRSLRSIKTFKGSETDWKLLQ